MEKIEQLYSSLTGVPPASVVPLKQAGSNRQYYRMADADGKSVIGVVGTSREENHAFITLSRHFLSKGLAVPEVYAVDDDEMRYIQQDLGTLPLYDAIRHGREHDGRYNAEEEALLADVMAYLPKIQIIGAEGLDWGVCYPQPSFDVTNVMFDLNYFKYCFLKATGTDFHEMRLEEDFMKMASDLTPADDNAMTGFMYRDFQARNIMIDSSGDLAFIDFQGGRRGPVYYDVASFLWQASARYPDSLRHRLAEVYYDALSRLTTVPDPEVFTRRLKLFVLFRIMQVLGAYGFRGFFERKDYFIKSIPPALENLREVLPTFRDDYPYLTTVLDSLVNSEKLMAQGNGCLAAENVGTKPENAGITPRKSQTATTVGTSKLVASKSKYDGQGELVVKVWSFSYKKGIPADDSGNGGGYVFDCRATHNPGRYEMYRSLTGLDEPVIRFLEDDGEIVTFLGDIYPLAERHVKRYIERSFTSLTFAFGCTGGQHRSVYCAQHLAEHIHKTFGIKVILRHREQNIQCTLQ